MSVPHNTSSRILAVDVRNAGMAFVAVEKPMRVLGFGVSRHTGSPLRVSALIARFRPSVIVLRQLKASSRRDQRQTLSVIGIFRAQARSSEIPIILVSESAIEQFFDGIGMRNKYQIAARLASWFPILAWKLPLKRKFYKPEPWTMMIFDALSVAVVHLYSTEALKPHGEESES